jgi:hypothetical protein
MAGTALAQTSAASRTSASASDNTSVSASKSGAQATSSATADAAETATLNHNNSQAAAASQLESGTAIHATLDKPVDVRKAKPGDQVVAKTTEDIKSNGQVVIPRGSKLVGHVTDVQARGEGQEESQLGLAFDHAVLKNGTRLPVSLGLQAVGSGSQSLRAEDDSLMSSGSGSIAGTTSAGARTGGGLVGGVGATTGGLVNTAGSTTGATLRSGTSMDTGLGAGTSLNSNSRGVVGLPGMDLASSTTTSGMITSRSSNVHLNSGTQMILRSR